MLSYSYTSVSSSATTSRMFACGVCGLSADVSHIPVGATLSHVCEPGKTRGRRTLRSRLKARLASIRARMRGVTQQDVDDALKD